MVLGLKTLKNFPCIPNLYILQVKNNKLTGEDFQELLKLYPNLYKLKLSNNLINSIDIFLPLEKSKIKKIEIEKNPVNENNLNFKEDLFNIMPNLITINREKKDGEILESTIYNESENSDEEDYENEEEEEYEEKEDESDEEESFYDEDEGED